MALSLRAGLGEAAGKVADGPGAVGAGGTADAGDVGGGGRVGGGAAVVAGDREDQAAGAGGAVGAELAGGGGDRVGGVVGVAPPVGGPGGRRPVGEVELHRAGAAAGAVEPGADPWELRAAVVGLDLPDAGEERPRQARAPLLHGGPVQGEVAGGD